MRTPSHRYSDLASEEFSDLNGIDQTLALKAMAGGNRGGATTDFADGISFRKKNIATDGLAYPRLPYATSTILAGVGRGLGLFQFYDNPMTFAAIMGAPTTTNNSTPAQDWQLSGLNLGVQNAFTSISSQADIALSSLVSHTALNGYDIIADGVNFARIAGASRTYSNIIQQPAAPTAIVSTASPYVYSSQFGSVGSPFVNQPTQIAVDTSGNLYVVDEGSSVYKFNSAGVQQTFAITGISPTKIGGIYVDGSGNVYISDELANAVYKLNSSGAYQSTFSGSPAFNFPRWITQDGSSNFWVGNFFDNKFFKFNSSGVLQNTYTLNAGTGSAGACIDGSGNIYICVQFGSPSVQKYNSSAVYQSSFTGYTFAGPEGITIDGASNFQITDTGNNCLVTFNSSAVFQYTTGSLGNGNGQFHDPEGITYKSSTLYIVDHQNYRVQVFTPSAGSLTGDYAWCYTLKDANGNESQPSQLGWLNGLSAQNVQLTITPGANVSLSSWTTIIVYRTLTSGSQVTAALNPTFYHVPGLDTPLTSATTYTLVDSQPDSALTNVNNYQMTNVAYENGALAAVPPGWVPKYCMAWLGVTFGCSWKDQNGVAYPRRVMWSAATDNSQTANGNITSWNSFNYTDIGDSRTGNILGCFPGLQGRAYIWCENATFLVLSTGNAAEPYDFVQISNQYGFYHHSVAEVTGGVIGRTKDGIAIFNGALFQHISHQVLRTLGSCIVPDADSGAFDFKTQRYYCAVCDTSLLQSFLPTVQGTGTQSSVYSSSIMNAMRNTVLVFDMPTKRWEIYQRTPIQYFAQFKDSSGKPGVFALGMSSEIMWITQGNACGATWGNIATVASTSTVTVPYQLTAGFVKKDVYIPFSLGADSLSVAFLDYKSTVTSYSYSAPNSTLGFQDGIPGSVSSMMTMIDNAGGSTPTKSYPTTDSNNTFASWGVYGYGVCNLDPNTLVLQYKSDIPSTYYNNGNYLNVSSSATSTLSLATNTSSFEANTLYTILPYRWFNTFSSVPHLMAYLTPPFGYKAQEHRKKNFNYLVLKMKGTGPVKIDVYVDTLWTPNNNATPTTTVYLTGTSALNLPNMQEVRIPIGRNPGYIMRVMITGIRGLTKFEIDDIVALWSWLEPYSAK